MVLDRAVINAIVMKDGTANWDIMKDSPETEEEEEDSGSSDLNINLKKFSILNSKLII
jgi:uncharacterized protein involved in outer membrane biogenesis